MALRRKPSQYRALPDKKVQALQILRTNTASRPAIDWSTFTKTAYPLMDYASTTKQVPNAELGRISAESVRSTLPLARRKAIPFNEWQFLARASPVSLGSPSTHYPPEPR